MSNVTSAVSMTLKGAVSAQPVAAAGLPNDGCQSLFLTRSPVFDMGRHTAGYELMMQLDPSLQTGGSPAANCAGDRETDADHAALLLRQSIHQLIHVVGLDVFLGKGMLFMPMTARNLLEEDFSLLPAQQTCLMWPGGSSFTPELAAVAQSARQSGYSIAMDCTPGQTHDSGLMEFAQYVRVHIGQASRQALEALVMQQNAGGPAVIGCGIHTAQSMEQAATLGLRYVQGEFFCQPEQVSGRELAATHMTQLKFLAQLSKPVLDFDELEITIKCDVALTCNLLRYMNSAAMGVKRKITSVKQALVLLGEKPMRQWGALIAITALAGDKPHELLVASLVRARFCETLARRQNMDEQTLDLFLTGLLSMLDVMLGTSMDEALASVPVPQQVRDVLAGDRSSVMGQMFALACSAQRGAWGSVIELANQLHLPHHEMATLYYQTLQWTHDFFSAPAEA